MKTKEERNKALKEEFQKQKLYEQKEMQEKAVIKACPHHFSKLLWYYIKKPFIWIKDNIKDWRTAVIFIIVFLLLSSEVWIFYLLGIIFQNAWFYAVASTCWLFWLGPATPFLPLCICITILIKGLFNKIRFKNIMKESNMACKKKGSKGKKKRC